MEILKFLKEYWTQIVFAIGLIENNKEFTTITNLSFMPNDKIDENNILANIEIIANCLYPFKNEDNIRFLEDKKPLKFFLAILKQNGFRVQNRKGDLAKE